MPNERRRAPAGSELLARMRALARDLGDRRPFFTPQADAYLVTCEAEWSRVEGASDPDLWAAPPWPGTGFQMPYPKAYALMREAEAALAGPRDRGRARPPWPRRSRSPSSSGPSPCPLDRGADARAGTGARRGRGATGRGAELERARARRPAAGGGRTFRRPDRRGSLHQQEDRLGPRRCTSRASSGREAGWRSRRARSGRACSKAEPRDRLHRKSARSCRYRSAPSGIVGSGT